LAPHPALKAFVHNHTVRMHPAMHAQPAAPSAVRPKPREPLNEYVEPREDGRIASRLQPLRTGDRVASSGVWDRAI
jgi:hypothetical protein